MNLPQNMLVSKLINSWKHASGHELCPASPVALEDRIGKTGNDTRLHILSVLFSNLCGKGGESELAVQKQGVLNRPPSVV